MLQYIYFLPCDNLKWRHFLYKFIRRQPSEVFCKRGVLRTFAKFTGKHLCQSIFFNKRKKGKIFFDKDLRPATLLKKILWHRCFPVNFAKFLRTPFLQNTSGRLLLFIVTQRRLFATVMLLRSLKQVYWKSPYFMSVISTVIAKLIPKAQTKASTA